jgi:hypothetical protein
MSKKQSSQSVPPIQAGISRYRDFAQAIESTEELAISKSTSQASDQCFPVKLHYVLSVLETDGYSQHIASWAPHGRCFKVHNTKEFVEKILPQ